MIPDMIHSTSLPAFSGATAPQRSAPVRTLRDLVPVAAQAAPALRPQVNSQPGVVPPSNTPRGSLLNLQV